MRMLKGLLMFFLYRLMGKKISANPNERRTIKVYYIDGHTVANFYKDSNFEYTKRYALSPKWHQVLKKLFSGEPGIIFKEQAGF